MALRAARSALLRSTVPFKYFSSFVQARPSLTPSCPLMSRWIIPTKQSFPPRRLKKSTKIFFLVPSESRFTLGFFIFAELFRDGRLAPYLAKARIIYATIHPFLDLTRVFYAGLPEVTPEDGDDDEDPK